MVPQLRLQGCCHMLCCATLGAADYWHHTQGHQHREQSIDYLTHCCLQASTPSRAAERPAAVTRLHVQLLLMRWATSNMTHLDIVLYTSAANRLLLQQYRHRSCCTRSRDAGVQKLALGRHCSGWIPDLKGALTDHGMQYMSHSSLAAMPNAAAASAALIPQHC